VNVVRFGAMRQQVAGLEAVLADGTIVRSARGLAKDSIGWEPASLLTGSEGTLAVITRVLLRLEPTTAHRVTALVALSGGVDSAVALISGPLGSLPELEAAELTLPAGMALVTRHDGLPSPIALDAGATAWLTVEAAGDSDPTERLADLLGGPSVLDVAVASEPAARARLWAYRERHPEAIASLGIPHKLDVATTLDRLPELLASLPERVSGVAPDAQIIVFGHIAEGNMHVNVVGPSAEDDRADDAVLRLVMELGGSISAEHGIGIAKRRWLADARSAAELDLLRRVKLALDPAGTLNPGVLEPLSAPAEMT
jgi:FAD/FMN-containing dehydrogenase